MILLVSRNRRISHVVCDSLNARITLSGGTKHGHVRRESVKLGKDRLTNRLKKKGRFHSQCQCCAWVCVGDIDKKFVMLDGWTDGTEHRAIQPLTDIHALWSFLGNEYN